MKIYQPTEEMKREFKALGIPFPAFPLTVDQVEYLFHLEHLHLPNQHPSVSPAEHHAKAVARAYAHKPRWKRLGRWEKRLVTGALLLLAILFAVYSAHAQTTNSNITSVGGTPVDPAAGIPTFCVSGCGGASADTTASGVLGSLNATLQIAMAGVNSAAVTLPAANNLVGTLLAESSSDGGTTWAATVIRSSASTGLWGASVAVSSTNASYNIQVPGGASHVRARVNPYTSGTATASIRATTQPDSQPDPLVQGTQAAGSATQPNPQVFGGWDGSNVRSLKTDSSGVLQMNLSGLAVACSGLPALTGDVTTSSGSCADTIANNAVTQAKVTNGYVDLSSTQASIAGNKSFTGSSTFNKINGICYLDGVINTTLAQAITCAGSNGTIEVTPSAGTVTVAVNATIPPGVQLKVDAGSAFSINTGITIDFSSSSGGVPLAGGYQIFSYTGTGKVINMAGEVNPVWFPGAELGAQTNNAIAACSPASSAGCIVYISYGDNFTNGKTYTYNTTINYPMVTGGAGNFKLKCAEGVLLSYTGSSYAIEALTTAANQTNAADVNIEGCHILGQSTGLGGIHLYSFSVFHLANLDISGFTGKNAAGIVNDGANTGLIENSNIRGNAVGMINQCVTASFTGTYCVAGLHSIGNHYQVNTGPGVVELPGVAFSGTAGSAGNTYQDVIEGNGGNSISPIAVATGSATASTTANLITVTVASTAGLTRGMVVVQTAFSVAAYNGRFTIENIPSATTYTYSQTSSALSATGGTVVAHIPQVNIVNGNATAFIGGFMQFGSSVTNMIATINLGGTSENPSGTVIEGVSFSSTGAVSTIDSFGGVGTVIQGNVEINAITNFVNAGASASQIFLGKNNSAATNYNAGTSTAYDIVLSNSKNATTGMLIPVAAGLAPTANGIIGYDSTANKYSVGANGTNFKLPHIVASGTSALTTAGIATGACGTTVTTTATGALTTDRVDFTRNAAATNGNGGNLILNSWTTSGNINWNYCNPSAGTVTPTAMTVNWAVMR